MHQQQRSTTSRRTRASRLLRRALPTVCGLAFVLFTFYFLLPESAYAQVNTGINQFGEATVLSGDDIRVVVARIIRTFLGVLGAVGVGIVLYGGFLWMTAKGEPDKLETAKKVLANGAIGLAIVLSSFGIAQFVLNKLVEATGSGAAQTTGGGGGGGPPGGLPGGCVDPGGIDPYICSISPIEGPVGSYVTLRGYRFGAYVAGTSVVKLGATPAAVVACGRLPNWSDNLAVVEVPELDPDAYPVSLTNKDGRTTTFSSGLASGFTVTTAPLGPQIACIDPNFGPETTPVRIEGKRFGDPASVGASGPTMTSVTPMQARPLQFVTIGGTGFGTIPGTVVITGDGFSQTISPASQFCGPNGWKDDEVVIEVPAYPPDTYNLTVVTNGGISSNLLSGFTITSPSSVPIPPRVCRSVFSGSTVAIHGLFGSGQRGVRINDVVLPTISYAFRVITANTTAAGALRRSDVLEVVNIFDASVVSNPVRIAGSVPLPLLQRCQSNGANCGTVQFRGGPEGATSATTTAWSDTEISASVPAGAITGDASVIVDALTSNGYQFWVTCDSGAQCSPSNCCIANACFTAAACLGRTCTTDADCGTGQWCNAGRCEERRSCTSDADCPTGQVCDMSSQTCRTPKVGDPCDADTTDAVCTVDAAKCGALLVCGDTTCKCETPPAGLGGPLILDVSPAHRTKTDGSLERCALATDTGCVPNGAPGNLLTIRGSNFGDDAGSVTIAGVAAAAPAACSTTDTWTDTAIVVAVPDGVTASGPIAVTVGGKSDATNDANGSRIADFQPNDVVRPGLCSATNTVPGGTTTAAGIQFGPPTGSAFVGTTPVVGAGVQNWTATSANVVVPLSVAAQQTTLAIASASGEQSNAVPLTIAQSVQAPAIESIAPGAAGPGAYVTIVGQRFGHSIGRVQFRRTVGTDERIYWLNAQLPRQCAQEEWWTDKRITLRIPDVLSQWAPQNTGARTNPINTFNPPQATDWRVEVCASTGQCSALFGTPFTVTAPTDLPGICALQPVQGPRGTEVRIIGERFGAQSGNVWFQDIAASLGSGGDLQFWSEQLVRVLVPQSAGDGRKDVRLWQRDDNPAAAENSTTPERENRGSNAVPFTVADCRTQSNACTTSQLCCPANGQCVEGAAECPVPVNQGAYQWTFTTGILPPPSVVPRVVESCEDRSPSPWDRHPDGDACTNALVRIMFTLPMAVQNNTAGNYIKVYKCTATDGDPCARAAETDGNIASDALRFAVGQAQQVGDLITIYPNVPWDASTTYEVLVCGTVHGELCAPITSAAGVRLNGNEDGTGGADYRFRFRTGAGECAIDGVAVSPSRAIATQPWPEGQKAADLESDPAALYTVMHPGLVHFSAGGTNRTARCQELDPRNVPWTWSAVQPAPGKTYAAVDIGGGRWCTALDHCALGACVTDGARKNQCVLPVHAHTVTARAFHETPQPVKVTASAQVATAAWCGDGVVNGSEQCDGPEVQSCIAGANARGTLALRAGSDVLDLRVMGRGSDGALQTNDDVNYLIGDTADLNAAQVRDIGDRTALVLFRDAWWEYPVAFSGTRGAVQLQLMTSNATPAPFERLTGRDVGSSANPRWRADYRKDDGELRGVNVGPMPLSETSGGPLQFHLRVYARSGSVISSSPVGEAWIHATAPENIQTTTLTLGGLSVPFDALRIVWDNDAASNLGTGSTIMYDDFDLNLILHDVRFTATQTRPCGATCTADPWTTCQPLEAPMCGDGTVEAPETCDPGASGDWSSCSRRTCTALTSSSGGAGTTISGSADLTVDFQEMRVAAHYPKAGCAEVCTNATIAAIMSTPMESRAYSVIDATDAGDGTWTNDVGLFKCEDSACFRTTLTPVAVTGAVLCNDGSADGACAQAVGTAPQLLIVPTGALAPRSYYRVVVRNTVENQYGRPLTGLNYESLGSSVKDAYAWTFQTGEGSCGIHRVEVVPEEVMFRAIGDVQTIRALGYSRPDSCSPDGQPINAEREAWTWNIDDEQVAGFIAPITSGWSTPEAGGTIATNAGALNRCTLQCLPVGSRRANGICGNEVLEAPAEECEKTGGAFPPWCDATSCLRKGTTAPICGNGDVNDGEECDRVDADGNPSIGGTFVHCDAARCIRTGTDETECKNSTLDTGEDCIGGNTINGDGCSARCLAEGTPSIAVLPVRCGDGLVGVGEECEVCAGGGNPTRTSCGASGINTNSENWNTVRCDFNRCLWLGTRQCSTTVTTNCCGNGGTLESGEQCDDGNTSGGDGCSAQCLFEGSSLAHRTAIGAPLPSMCADAVVGAGELAACEVALGDGGSPDPLQILSAVGTAAPVGDVQRTEVQARASSVEGTAAVLLRCGFFRDDQCSNVNTHGVNTAGCCAVRPTVIASTWEPPATDACPNALVGVTFDQRMDLATIGTTVVDGVVRPKGAAIVRCVAANPTGCPLPSSALTLPAAGAQWEFVSGATPKLEDAEIGTPKRTVSRLTFTLDEPLEKSRKHAVVIAGKTTSGSDPVRSVNGVALYDTASWTFTTASSLCALTNIFVEPSSALLQRSNESVPLTATGYSGENPITSLAGVYAWQYTWASSDPDIATVAIAGDLGGVSCTVNDTCASRVCAEDQCASIPYQNASATPTASSSGRAIATATATVAVPAGSPAIGDHGKKVSGSARLQVMYCEHPWPDPDGSSWLPHVIDGEDIAISYCRDFGMEKVCRTARATQDPATPVACTSDTDCSAAGLRTDRDATDPQDTNRYRCLPRLNDDLPVPEDMDASPTVFAPLVTKTYTTTSSTVPITTATPGARELRKEFFLLPRNARNATSTTPAKYCSGSGERCEDLPNGFCPPGEFCKPADDAIGIRLYENEEHVAAAQWYKDEWDEDASTSVTVDGYRGVQAGRSTYINYANTGSLFTNLAVLSYNDDATAETRTIFQRIMDTLAFTTDLEAGNSRVCSVDATVSCTSDFDCAAQKPSAGTCNAPADKLRRDVQRVEDLALLQRAITNVTEGRRRCSVTERSCAADSDCPSGEACVALPPALASGTFLSGMTTSKWPSWQQELGRELGITLPTDPLNAFGSACKPSYCAGYPANSQSPQICTTDSDCLRNTGTTKECVLDDTNTDYEQTTCWNATRARYTCPAGSRVYQYRRAGDAAYLGVEFEYARVTDWQPQLPTTDLVRVEESICEPTTSSTRAAVCGDGLEQFPENCEPGITPPDSKTCTRSDSKTGFATRSCNSSCTWTIIDDIWNSGNPIVVTTGGLTDEQCTVKCGNGVVDDTSEQCDVGPAGGRVPVRDGKVPGITLNTSYACTAQCQWATDAGELIRCGDNKLQSGYGERCDGTAGIATTMTDSTEFKQYFCDPLQCQPTGGYCGDYTITNGEDCNRDETVSCVSTAATFNSSNKEEIDIYSLEISTNSATVRFENRITSTLYHPTSGLSSVPTAVGYFTGESAWFVPMEMLGDGDVLVTLVTSNNSSDVENLSGSTMQTYVNNSAEDDAITDFNPDGVRGTGVYHRIHVGTWTGSAPTATTGTLSPLVTRMVRATALTSPQTTEVLLTNVADSVNYLVLIWDNDFSSGGADSNLALHTAAIASTRTHRCGDPGAGNACTWDGYSDCTAIPTCGNGDVDDGEDCDDSRADGAFAGRCSNDPKKQCYRKPNGTSDECADGGTCESNADACTTSCRANMCGDANRLVAQSCIAGLTIGKACRTNGDCGTDGVCAQEACDQGVAGNWTAEPCNPSLASCIENAACAYGRTCNYCTTQCTVVTKQGGFCGDGILQAPPGAKRCVGSSDLLTTRWTCDNYQECLFAGQGEQCVFAPAGAPVGSEICDAGRKAKQCTPVIGVCTYASDKTCNDSCTGPR